MRDEEIVALYWQRDETAIHETQRKYERYLTGIAHRILCDFRDCRESVNDTYWKAWTSMPPHRPDALSTYLGRIARQTAIDRWRAANREKRRASEYALSLGELEECVAGSGGAGEAVEQRLLASAIAAYLRGLPDEARTAFVERYYYMEPIRAIASRRGCGEARIKSLLHRIRQGLRAHLEQEGFFV